MKKLLALLITMSFGVNAATVAVGSIGCVSEKAFDVGNNALLKGNYEPMKKLMDKGKCFAFAETRDIFKVVGRSNKTTVPTKKVKYTDDSGKEITVYIMWTQLKD